MADTAVSSITDAIAASNAATAAARVAIGLPKKRNRPPKKKQKNAQTKNNLQKPNTSNPPTEGETSNAEPPKPESENSDGLKNIANTQAAAGGLEEESKNVTPKKKNSNQRTLYPPKKKTNTTSKPTNTMVQNNSPSKPLTPQSKDSVQGSKVDYDSERERVKASREEKKYQMDMQRRRIEEERWNKWYKYFLYKPNDLITLDRKKVIVMRTVEKNQPQAQFVCLVCNYLCDNMSVVAAHVRKTTHIRNLQEYVCETTVHEMPDMPPEHMAVLQSHLMQVVASHRLDSEHLETRRTIGALVSEMVSSNLPGCTIRLFGSSIHGLGLKTADVNIDFQVPEGCPPPAMLKEVAVLCRKSTHFDNVVENFNCEFPFVSFRYKKSGEQCSLSLNNERAVNLAILLSKYTPLDPRLGQLATLYRLWGQVTESDKAQEGTWPGYAFYLMTIFYLQQCKNPVLPVLNDFLTEKGESESANTTKVLSMDVSEIKQKWYTNNKQSLAQLWLGLLRFYAVDFAYKDFIVSIDSSALIPRRTSKVFIVDPFLPTRNVARSITSNSVFNYIMNCLVTTCLYYGMPQTKHGPLFGEIHTPTTKYHADHEAILETHEKINSQLIQLILKLDSQFVQPKIGIQESVREVMQLMHMHNFNNIDNIPVNYLQSACGPSRRELGGMSVSASDARLIVLSCSPRSLQYVFTAANCTGGKKVPRICAVCKDEGHLKDDCPEEKLPPLNPLPPLTREAVEILDNLCQQIFDKWRQKESDLEVREDICDELEEYIQGSHPTTRLQLFGSTKNGFGLKGSDMDMCLTFDDNTTGQGLDTRGFIEVLFKLLKGCKAVQEVVAIATAKVPIVKFTHRATRLDGDISLYNVLAMDNTKLLWTYASIDQRVRVLGYMMKRFSKVCRIGDASKGSLSSYAYTLLVIYFLQHCDPPVLPNLQELTESGGPPPKDIVEGCNAYFFKDLSKLDSVWSGRGKNTHSVGELWLHLLVFYTEQFDLLNNVVTIRCSQTVSKFDKLWISKGIAIEDPFDLSHNLGSALTRKMSLYIVKALRKGRNHFARPMNPNANPRDIEVYYMNARELTDGEPPNDRGCRVCKSIGHKEKFCPEKKKRNKTKQNKKKEGTPKKDERPVKKAPVKNTSDDDEDDDNNNDDESDLDSEQDDELVETQLVETQLVEPQPTRRREPFKKRASKHIAVKPPAEADRCSQGFQHPPPGFVQEQNRLMGPQFSPFAPRNSKPTNTPVTETNPSSEAAFTPSPSSNTPDPVANEKAHIPTIVFSNSKLINEALPSSLPQPRFAFPPGQEAIRPPPGFIPLQNGQRFPNSVPYLPEAKAVGQNWNYQGVPLLASSPGVDMLRMRMGPLYPRPQGPRMLPPSTRPSMGPLVASGGSPRPSVGPAFNSLRFGGVGVLGPTEQLIWGQSTNPSLGPGPGPNPYQEMAAALSKMQIFNSPLPGHDLTPDELKTTELNMTRNNPVPQSFLAKANGNRVLDNST